MVINCGYFPQLIHTLKLTDTKLSRHLSTKLTIPTTTTTKFIYFIKERKGDFYEICM